MNNNRIDFRLLLYLLKTFQHNLSFLLRGSRIHVHLMCWTMFGLLPQGQVQDVVTFKPQSVHVLHPQTNSLHIYKDPVPPLALNSIIFQKGSVKQKWICRKLQMFASFFMNTWRQRRRMKSGESSKAGEWWGMRGRRLQQWEMISILLQGLSCFSYPVLWLPFEKSAYALLFMSLFQGNKL